MKKPPREPAKRIFDPAFRYRRSHETDIRETFERVRRELAGGGEATEPLHEGRDSGGEAGGCG
jgi:hypothetical protein